MQMNADTINHEFDLLSHARKRTALKRRGRYYVGPCPFCGGTDRFVLKQTPRGWRWFCRKCGAGKYRTSIDYIMQSEHRTFMDALTSMGGSPDRSTAAGVATQFIVPQRASAAVTPDAAWQADAWRQVDEASTRLIESHVEPPRAYLTKRGLEPLTWKSWQLGFAHVWDLSLHRERRAIVIPWFDDESITAVKYRFLDDDPSGLRYTCKPGSVPILFGLWAAKQDHDTLLLIEGEINAMSAWQCMPTGVTCLSFGSQTAPHMDVIAAAARPYRRVFVWADDPKRALAIHKLLGPAARPVCSPDREGVKLDANALLQQGDLSEFLAGLLGVKCLGTGGAGG